MTNPIRVLVVDDSAAYRDLISTVLRDAPDMQVIGTAANGAESVNLASKLKPDIITMDIHMPVMDGFEATRQIMSSPQPCPILMVSASIDKNERMLTFEALRAGALSVVGKPTLFAPPEVLNDLVSQVRLMSEVKVVRRWGQLSNSLHQAQPVSAVLPQPIAPTLPAEVNHIKLWPKVVVIASSTGGPGLLATILGQIPADFPVPILIVQHITPGFGIGLAEWLNQQCPLNVRVAKQGEDPRRGQVLIAPDDYHMTINNLGRVALNQNPQKHGVRPSADYLFESIAQAYGARAVGVVLTGMGGDGAEGLLAMRRAGAQTIAQDKLTSVVFGMPAVAIELGAAQQILPGHKVAESIKLLCGK